MGAIASQAVIDAELARLLHRQAPASQTGGLFVAVTMVAIFSDRLMDTQTLVWIALFISTLLLRTWLWRHYADRIADDAGALQWRRALLIALGYSSCVWAIAAWLYAEPQAPLDIGLYIAVFVCLFAGAIGSLAPSLLGYMVYCGPIALSLIVSLFTVSGIPVVVAVGLLGFVVVCLFYTRNINRTLIENIELQIENQSLVDELLDRSAALEVAARHEQAANESKSRFLAVATHDLAQPLHALELFIAALQRESDESKRQTLIDNVGRSTERLSDMFSSLLDLSRLDSQVVQVDFKNVALSSVLEPLISESHSNAKAKGLQFVADYPDVLVHTDPNLLHRILLNLINNALTHTAQGSITLSAIREGDKLMLKLTDTGVGISADEQSKVFQEYYQANPGRGEGMGLGLSIVTRLTGLLDIEMQMESEPRVGTTFTLAIACSDEPASVATPLTALPSRALLESLNILYIDDMASSRQAMQAILFQWGCEHLVAAAPEEVPDDFQPDLLITDYRLGAELTGLDVAAAFRARWPALPILIVTGDTSPAILQKIQRSDIPYLLKPTSEASLQRAIVELVEPPDQA